MSIIGNPILVRDNIILPDGYKRAVYISSSTEDSVEISLGYTPTSATKIWFEYFSNEITPTITWAWLLSAGGHGGIEMHRKNDTNDFQLRSYDEHYGSLYGALETGFRSVTIDLQNRVCTGSGTTKEIVLDEGVTFDVLTFLVRNYFSPCQMKIWESGNLVRHYVACSATQTLLGITVQVPGMYELKTGTFYNKSSGDGTPTYCPYIE